MLSGAHWVRRSRILRNAYSLSISIQWDVAACSMQLVRRRLQAASRPTIHALGHCCGIGWQVLRDADFRPPKSGGRKSNSLQRRLEFTATEKEIPDRRKTIPCKFRYSRTALPHNRPKLRGFVPRRISFGPDWRGAAAAVWVLSEGQSLAGSAFSRKCQPPGAETGASTRAENDGRACRCASLQPTRTSNARKHRDDFLAARDHRLSGDWVAGGLGFEPRQPESESGVLPLDDPPS